MYKKLLEDLFLYSDLLPLLVILLLFKKIKEWPIKVIFCYSLYSFINNQVLLFTSDPAKVSKLIYFFTLFEYLLFVTLIYLIIVSRKAKTFLIVASPVFAAVCLYFIFGAKLKAFDSVQTGIECIIIISFCLFYFYERLVSPQVINLFGSYQFWIILALLLYLSGAFFLFVFAVDLPDDERNGYWPILHVCGIIRNILFAIAVYLSTRPPDEYYDDDYLYDKYDKIDD
jgi:hypothetical protein